MGGVGWVKIKVFRTWSCAILIQGIEQQNNLRHKEDFSRGIHFEKKI